MEARLLVFLDRIVSYHFSFHIKLTKSVKSFHFIIQIHVSALITAFICTQRLFRPVREAKSLILLRNPILNLSTLASLAYKGSSLPFELSRLLLSVLIIEF